MSSPAPIYLIYRRSGLLLSRKPYPDWRSIQAEFPDYQTSLGPWSAAEVRKFLADEYPDAPPFPPEQLADFLVSTREHLEQPA